MAKSRLKVDPGVVRDLQNALSTFRNALLRAGDLASTPVIEVPPSERITLSYVDRLATKLRERFPL